MGSGASFRDASGHGVNHDLTPLNIQAGGDPRVIWQGPGDSSGEDVGGGEEGVATDTGTSKHNQVPLGSPLCSRDPNIGVGGIGGQHSVAGVDQYQRRKGCLGTEGRHERVMREAKHKVRPGRRGRVLGTDLGRGGFRAKGRVGGAWSSLHFHSDFGKGCLLLTLFLAHCLRHDSRGNEFDRGSGGGREWGGGNRGQRQISRHLGKCSGSHLALFQGAWHRSANVRGRVQRFTGCHNGVFVLGKGRGEEWVRKTGGGRDLDWKPDRADYGGKAGRGDKFQEAIDDCVKAKGFDGVDIRGRCRPKGHGGRHKHLEGSGEGKLGNRAQKHVDITFVDAMRRDERRDGCRGWGGGNEWVGEQVATAAAFFFFFFF